MFLFTIHALWPPEKCESLRAVKVFYQPALLGGGYLAVVAGDSGVGQADGIVRGFADGVDAVGTEAKMLAAHLRTHQDGETVLGFYLSIDRCGTGAVGGALRDAEVFAARRAFGAFAGVGVFGLKSSAALACNPDRHDLPRLLDGLPSG